MFKRFASLITLVLLAACTTTPPTQQETAVPPTAAVSTDTPVPTPSVIPTKTAIPPAATVAPTATPGEALSLDAFVSQLEAALALPDYDALQPLMADTIGVGPWRSEWSVYTPATVVGEMEAGGLPTPTNVAFSNLTSEEIGNLLGTTPETMLGPDMTVATVLHSTGWGQTGDDEAILFVTEEEDGRFKWSAFLYTFGAFESVSTTLVAPPVGVIYRVPNEGLFQIGANGEPALLLDAASADIPNLSIAPDGRHAAYYDESNQLWIVDIPSEEETQIGSEYGFAPGILLWGNNSTLLTGVWLDPNEADGPNFGHVTVVDIETGEVNILESDTLSAGRPALSPDGDDVAFDVFSSGPDDLMTGRIYTPAAGLNTFQQDNFDAQNELLQGRLFNPAWSSDGSQIAWLVSTGDRFAIQVFNWSERTAVQIFDWDPARFGGLVPSPVWSPDDVHIALHVLANGLEGSGIWVIASDGSSSNFVSPQGVNPHWVDSVLLAYDSPIGIMMHELNSEPLLRMDLPEGAQFVTIGAPGGEAVPQSALPDPASLPLAGDAIVATSPDGTWETRTTRTEPQEMDDGSSMYYTTLSVTDGSQTWQPVSEWRNWGLGYTMPEPFRWSEDGGYLYYSDVPNPDGCFVFVNGGALWRLNLENGAVEAIAPDLGMVMDLSPDAEQLAVNAYGRGFLIYDLATSQETSIALPDPGAGWNIGGLLYSPTGEHLLLTQVINACGGGESTTAVVRIDVKTARAETILESSEHNFTLLEWIREDEVRMSDETGQIWFIDVFSGEIASGA